MLTAAATHAFPAPPKSRGEALAGLRSPSEAARAEAVNWIANRGAMADAPLLHERLRDDSETVREFAEQGLWLLWGRSGDDEIDRRMARGTGEMQAGRLADSVATFSEIIRGSPISPRAGTGAPRRTISPASTRSRSRTAPRC